MASSLCPNCVQPMILMRAIGRSGGLADLNIYECKHCNLSLTEAVAILQPRLTMAAQTP